MCRQLGSSGSFRWRPLSIAQAGRDIAHPSVSIAERFGLLTTNSVMIDRAFAHPHQRDFPLKALGVRPGLPDGGSRSVVAMNRDWPEARAPSITRCIAKTKRRSQPTLRWGISEVIKCARRHDRRLASRPSTGQTPSETLPDPYSRPPRQCSRPNHLSSRATAAPS